MNRNSWTGVHLRPADPLITLSSGSFFPQKK